MIPKSRGFSMVEVVLAIGVCAFVLLAIFALLPVGLNNQKASVQQTIAVNIATVIMGDLNAAATQAEITAPGSSLDATSPKYQIDVTQSSSTLLLDEGGEMTADPQAARFKATVTLVLPPAVSLPSGSRDARLATRGTLRVDGYPENTNPLLTLFVALDRN